MQAKRIFFNAPYQERVLLLPHCLKDSRECRAETKENGLQCIQCKSTCQINVLRSKALRLGYKDVLIAPGGAMALDYIKRVEPKAVLAIACEQELKHGSQKLKSLKTTEPAIWLIELTKDGCVDTRVDLDEALKKMEKINDEFF